MELSDLEIETQMKTLKSLTSCRNLTEEQLKAKAIKALQNRFKRQADKKQAIKDKKNETRQLNLQSGVDIAIKFKAQSEKRMAVDLLTKYLDDYEIQTISDKNTLQEVIYLEVLQMRLQEKLNEVHGGEVKALPYDIISTMHKNSEVIIRLKATLGLNKQKEKLDAFNEMDKLKKRFQVWRNENQGSRTLKCPHCTKFIMLKMRTEAWEAQAHPFFKDNMIYNKHLFAHLGQRVLIDNIFVAAVLETSKNYIEWVQARVQNPGSNLIVAPVENVREHMEVVDESNQEQSNPIPDSSPGSQFDRSTTERPGG